MIWRLLVSTSISVVLLVIHLSAVILVAVRPFLTSPFSSLLSKFSAVLGKISFYSSIVTFKSVSVDSPL